MRCIPEGPEFGEGQLAEKAVWTALKTSLPDDCVLAHSVHVRDGRNEYEIDLLVLWPGVGMAAAIEVKGGQVSIADGQWYQSDRNQKRKIQSPVAQSQSSLHSFKNWLENQLGSRLSSRCVYMVSLPYTDMPGAWTVAGSPRSLILDQTQSKSPADLVRQAIEKEGGGAAPLAAAFLERIVRRLSGNLDSAVVPSTTSQQDEDAQDHLTERQSVLLQATRSLPGSVSPAARAAARPGSLSRKPGCSASSASEWVCSATTKASGNIFWTASRRGGRPSLCLPASSTNTCAG